MSTLAETIDRLTVEAELYQTLEDGAVRCFACGLRCLVRPGRRGVCQVRFNREGRLYAPWGYVAAIQADPIEKKPFYHVLPGHRALTFGMLGCNFHCQFCQNHLTSQALRDPASELSLGLVQRASPEALVQAALDCGVTVIASSYNEPLITSEWSAAIFSQAIKAGLQCVYISNGYATPEALRYLRPYLTAYKIDLKTMQDRQYRRLGGVLQNVLDSIRLAHELNIWVEVVTLVIPGFNDSTEELMEAARFLVSVSRDIPWHLTAFHPDYQMTGPDRTSSATLVRAAEIGQEAGLNYVYAGNMPGRVGEYETTRCPACCTALVERAGFRLVKYSLTPDGSCPRCGTAIAGVWG